MHKSYITFIIKKSFVCAKKNRRIKKSNNCASLIKNEYPKIMHFKTKVHPKRKEIKNHFHLSLKILISHIALRFVKKKKINKRKYSANKLRSCTKPKIIFLIFFLKLKNEIESGLKQEMLRNFLRFFGEKIKRPVQIIACYT